MSMRLDSGDVRQALKAFFTALNTNYTIDQAIQGSVCIGIKNVNPRTILESILRSAPPRQGDFTYRTECGVFIITPCPEDG
jgi:type II secretory pathway component GspD/PulD (secretin)